MIEHALIQATAEYIRKGRVSAYGASGGGGDDFVTVKPSRKKGKPVKGYKRRKPGKRVPTEKPPPSAPGEGGRTATALHILRALGHAGETLPAALSDFQRKNKLDPTGSLDPQTMQALRKKIARHRKRIMQKLDGYIVG